MTPFSKTFSELSRDELYAILNNQPHPAMTHKEKMHAGLLYDPMDSALLAEQLACQERLSAFNALPPSRLEERNALLREILAECGKNCYVEPPFRANWGGAHVHFGDGVYANFNLVCVDDGDIYVGSRTLIGPNVTICTAAHPLSPELRAKGLQYNRPVRIGKDVWIGAGATILPGVTIGAGSVVGAGSLVLHDIPPGVVAVGSPARAIRAVAGRAHDEPEAGP